MNIRLADLNDVEALTAVNVEAWQSSYRHFVDPAFLQTLRVSDRLEGFRKLALVSELHCFVAEEDNQIIGFCHAGLARVLKHLVKGEVWTCYVLSQYQRQGVGSRLWQTATQYLKDKNFAPYSVWVLAENKPARAFYEKQGGVPQHTQKVRIGEKEYEEVCYAFS